MLDVSSATAEAESGADFADNYGLSELCENNAEMIQTLSEAKEGEEDLRLADLAPASMLVQVCTA